MLKYYFVIVPPNVNTQQPIKKSDFGKICRTCLTKIDTNKNNSSIFSSDIQEKLSYFLPVQVDSNDCLPSTICANCTDIITKSYEFKKRCENSDKLLRDILEQSDNDDRLNDINCDTPRLEYDDSEDVKCPVEIIENCSNVEKNIELDAHKNDKSLVLQTSNSENKRTKTGRYRCDKCVTNYTDMFDFMKHLIEVHQIDPVAYKECDKTLRVPLQLKIQEDSRKGVVNPNESKKDEENHTAGELPFECHNCNNKFVDERVLEQHIRLYHDSQWKVCNICEHPFINLQLHMRQAHSMEFKCEQCPKVFSNKSTLNHHKLIIHEGRNTRKSFRCMTCSRKYSSHIELTKHLKIHSKDFRFECKYCGKRYKWRAAYKVHLITHAGEKPHVCILCDKRYATIQVLKRHMITHTGEKPYTCTL